MKYSPRRWSDSSLDYKLFFVLAFVMLLQFGAGGALGLNRGYSAAILPAAITALFLIVSAVHRARRQWRWRGVTWKDVLGAVFGVAVVVVFLYAATPLFPPIGPMLPWYLFGAAIGVWNLLVALNIAHFSRDDFDRDCGPPTIDLVEGGETPPARTWKDIVKAAFSILFFGVWLSFVARFYLTGVHLRDGAKSPDALHVYAVGDAPNIAYITAAEGQLYEFLGFVAFGGIPAIMMLGLVLHFLLKVPVLGDFGRRNSNR